MSPDDLVFQQKFIQLPKYKCVVTQDCKFVSTYPCQISRFATEVWVEFLVMFSLAI